MWVKKNYKADPGIRNFSVTISEYNTYVGS